ncbi:MAG: hypothetical protein ACI81L_001863 [Verrucomicrobiales bacterium]|jgi:hypothetical protein
MSPMMSKTPRAMMQPRWVCGDTKQRYRDLPWLSSYKNLVALQLLTRIGSVRSLITSLVVVAAAMMSSW